MKREYILVKVNPSEFRDAEDNVRVGCNRSLLYKEDDTLKVTISDKPFFGCKRMVFPHTDYSTLYKFSADLNNGVYLGLYISTLLYVRKDPIFVKIEVKHAAQA